MLSITVHLNSAMTAWDDDTLISEWRGFSTEAPFCLPVNFFYHKCSLLVEEEIFNSLFLLVLLSLLPNPGEGFEAREMILKSSSVPAHLPLVFWEVVINLTSMRVKGCKRLWESWEGRSLGFGGCADLCFLTLHRYSFSKLPRYYTLLSLSKEYMFLNQLKI